MEVKFERQTTEYYPDWGFRPRTPMWPMKMAFVFINGGLGDYVNWLRPIQWLAQRATWIHGVLYVPNYYVEIANYFMTPHKNWTVRTYEDMKNLPQKEVDTPLRGPVILQNEALNATGAHLSTCGWVYFTNKGGPPEGADDAGLPWSSYPQFDQAFLDSLTVPAGMKGLDWGKYAVVTTGVTTPSRHVTPERWNYVIQHIKERGLTPVFLGKRVTETGNVRNIHTEYSRDLKLDLGVDLLDQTSLIQAAAIMSRAKFVVGHDNGLLHLAGMTAAPLIFGYNLASPEHRRPVRPAGVIHDITTTHAELPCTHCQSNTNFVVLYNFRECFYRDLKCMDLLFENGAARWKTAIDKVMGEV